MRFLKTLKGVLILVCLISSSGCGMFDGIEDEINDTREQLVAEIDKGIRTIENSSISAERVLFDIAEQFREETKGLAYSADNILDAVVGDAGVEARCLVDFAGVIERFTICY